LAAKVWSSGTRLGSVPLVEPLVTRDAGGSTYFRPRCVVVMGVSGSGKSTVAEGLAQRLGWSLIEGDDLHPRANVDAMAAGRPLTDEERRPWLEAVGREIDRLTAGGASCVATCSALRRSYRDLLRAGRSGLAFCHVTADPRRLDDRLRHRSGHFMPASLLASQLALLEPLGADEAGITVSSDAEPAAVVDEVVARLRLDEGPEPAAGHSAEPQPLD
jgi:gluconokinase